MEQLELWDQEEAAEIQKKEEIKHVYSKKGWKFENNFKEKLQKEKEKMEKQKEIERKKKELEDYEKMKEKQFGIQSPTKILPASPEEPIKPKEMKSEESEESPERLG